MDKSWLSYFSARFVNLLLVYTGISLFGIAFVFLIASFSIHHAISFWIALTLFSVGSFCLYCAKTNIKGVLFNLKRRYDLYTVGYKRPPFLLWQRRSHWKENQFYTDISTSTDKVRPDENSCSDQNNLPPVFLYLWPDRLRWYFWLMGSIIALSMWIEGTWQSLYYGLFALIWMTLLIPWLIYNRFAVSMETGISFRTWPRSLRQSRWFESIPQLRSPKEQQTKNNQNPCIRLFSIIKNKMKCIVASLYSYCPPFEEQADSVYWAPRGSPQELFLRRMILALFKEIDAKNLYSDRGFRRFIIYWCAPIWNAYLLLLVLLVCAQYICPIDDFQLGLAAILWLVIATFYLITEVGEYARWTNLDINDLEFVLPLYLAPVEEKPNIPTRINNQTTLALVGVCTTLVTGLYLGMLRLI